MQSSAWDSSTTFHLHLLFFQSGDGYLVELATRYSTELRTNYGDVLQQLEDLRLAEWSDHAPPPPLAPGTTSEARQQQSYVNYPSGHRHPISDNEPTYVPGSYLVSPCPHFIN